MDILITWYVYTVGVGAVALAATLGVCLTWKRG